MRLRERRHDRYRLGALRLQRLALLRAGLVRRRFLDLVDEHPDCCDDQDDLKKALQDWYDGLEPVEQQAVRDGVQTWMDEQGVAPASGQSGKELVLETASERWAALTPPERRQWLDQRRTRIEQRQAAGSRCA